MARERDQVNDLLKRVFKQAPQALHHVFALDGANAAMVSLKTEETKMAYLIQVIGLQLHRASKEIGTAKPSDGPNDLRFHLMRTNSLFASPASLRTMLDLGNFEDMYYATCAKLKELLQGVDLLLANGFRSPEDTYLVYRRYERLKGLEPISISEFRASLLAYESILYSGELMQLLDKSIRQKILCDRYDGPIQMNHCHAQVSDAFDHTQAMRQETSKPTGLQNTSNMGCSMIFGNLAEKYRPMMLNTESEGPLISREPTPDAPQAFEERQFDSDYVRYISPYNLNERAKRLNVPGGPEMPCLCDPDCICAPVCASDPTQNCLCEENGLFTCVTQGMDIDDLDVPDLVRRKRHGSETSGSSAASLLGSPDFTGEPSHASHQATAGVHCSIQYGTMNEIEQQKHEQQSIAPTETYIQNLASMQELFESSEAFGVHSWQGHNALPLRVSGLSYRNALTQPFSKQCEYPPKRSSVAQRFFSSRRSGVRSDKKASALKQVRKGQPTTSSAKKAPNQAVDKHSRADISFTGLKLTLRRHSQMRG